MVVVGAGALAPERPHSVRKRVVVDRNVQFGSGLDRGRGPLVQPHRQGVTANQDRLGASILEHAFQGETDSQIGVPLVVARGTRGPGARVTLEDADGNEVFEGILDAVIASVRNPDDPWMTAADFRGYLDTQELAGQAYQDQQRWTRMSILNSAKSGRFSTDRTMREYNRDIWRLEEVPALPRSADAAPAPAAAFTRINSVSE